MTLQTSIHSTSDLSIALFLRMWGLKLIGVRSVGPGTARFVFEDTKDRPDLIMQFVNHESRCDPAAYIQTFKGLKALAMESQMGCEAKQWITHPSERSSAEPEPRQPDGNEE